MTIDDVVKLIDGILDEEGFNDDWDQGFNAALMYIRQQITGDFGNVN